MEALHSTPSSAEPKTGLIREQVHKTLRREILSCSLRPGEELREKELATRFEVSKSPVRDALQKLEREGLVSVEPRQGYRVTPISLADAKDMFVFRTVMESGCIKEAVRHASDTDLKRLDQFRQFTSTENIADDFIKYNNDFHSAVAACSGNARMAQTSRTLIDHMGRLIYLSLSVIQGREPQELVNEHCEIIDAMQDRNGRLACRLARSHVEEAEKRVIKALEWNMIIP
ncbi:GntR family transcriptional regulator [Halomonas sp. EGI 63088]|uniref:GntR family transcriptional regulator n=1 Tax=Halomonas flagellata TaxID=2920385 RepID=A0ABS9RZ40_9GAMM|nr:GntR family transcriptional regulator [Halomonas flagellata]MCH4565128.1 GntR family transcriptional regulator [Halomonas flagellata]